MKEALQVIKVELVTRGEDGEEVPLPDTVYNSTPIPDVTMTVKDSEITSSGTLKFTVDMSIHDPASVVTDNAADRLSGGSCRAPGNDLPLRNADGCWSSYDNSGAPRHPWRPPKPHDVMIDTARAYDTQRSTRLLVRGRTSTR